MIVDMKIIDLEGNKIEPNDLIDFMDNIKSTDNRVLIVQGNQNLYINSYWLGITGIDKPIAKLIEIPKNNK